MFRSLGTLAKYAVKNVPDTRYYHLIENLKNCVEPCRADLSMTSVIVELSLMTIKYKLKNVPIVLID